MSRERDRAYLAGLVDGEGAIGIALARPRSRGEMRSHAVYLTVSNTYLTAMDKMRELWGGTLVVRRASKESDRMIGNLRWSSRAAANVLQEIRPYLLIKHEQADLALEFMRDMDKRRSKTHAISEDEWHNRERLRVAIRQLNRPDPNVKPLPYPTITPQTCVFCNQKYTAFKSRKSKYCSQRCAQKARWQRVKSRANTSPN